MAHKWCSESLKWSTSRDTQPTGPEDTELPGPVIWGPQGTTQQGLDLPWDIAILEQKHVKLDTKPAS